MTFRYIRKQLKGCSLHFSDITMTILAGLLMSNIINVSFWLSHLLQRNGINTFFLVSMRKSCNCWINSDDSWEITQNSNHSKMIDWKGLGLLSCCGGKLWFQHGGIIVCWLTAEWAGERRTSWSGRLSEMKLWSQLFCMQTYVVSGGWPFFFWPLFFHCLLGK